jgi:DnaD/phage-associated family protein
MKKIFINGGKSEVTLISNCFLDEYMAGANGEFVKVYLYILRCMNTPDCSFSISLIADKLEHTEKDVIRALNYWAGLGIIGITYINDEIDSIMLYDLSTKNDNNLKDSNKTLSEAPKKNMSEELEDIKILKSKSQPVKEAEFIIEESEKIQSKYPKKELSNEELKGLLGNEDVKMILYIAQTYLGKTLNSSETNTILYFYNDLKFSTELIEYLIEYCVSNNHRAFRYIEKVAIDWAEEGIDSVSKAKEYTSSFSGNYYPVLKAFGLSGRNPAEVEKAFIVKWTDEYGFDTDIIVDACNRTINAIQKPSFQYADSILQRWYKKGVKSVDDLKSIDDEHEKNKTQKTGKEQTIAAPKTNFNNFQQRTYDYDEMERMLLSRK